MFVCSIGGSSQCLINILPSDRPGFLWSYKQVLEKLKTSGLFKDKEAQAENESDPQMLIRTILC
jgi:hypothetical protein